MKIAYIFKTNMAAVFQLAQMILPQLEQDTHKVQVVGMFFFDDNLFILRKGDEIGERLAKIAREKNILLMIYDACAIRRNMAKGSLEQCGTGLVTPLDVVDGVQVGCFPQLYESLAQNPPNQIITL